MKLFGCLIKIVFGKLAFISLHLNQIIELEL